MVRPKADEQHKQLAVYLIHALTAPSEHENPTMDTIARIGEHSVFDVLSKVFPRACRICSDNARTGVSLAELNKALEQSGIPRVRLRLSKREAVACNAAETSTYRFGGRRWRNPDNFEDMACLTNVWSYLSEHTECSLDEVTQTLRGAIAADDEIEILKRYKNVIESYRRRCSATCSEKDTDARSSSHSPRSVASSSPPGRFVPDNKMHDSANSDFEDHVAKLKKEWLSTDAYQLSSRPFAHSSPSGALDPCDSSHISSESDPAMGCVMAEFEPWISVGETKMAVVWGRALD